MVKPITLAQIKKLEYGDRLRLIGYYNADGTPQECKVTGKVQLWKTRPNEFRVPVKRGMYETGAIEPYNMDIFTLDHPAPIPKNEVYKGKRRK